MEDVTQEIYGGECPSGHFPFKEALSKRYFLVYISRTYTSMVDDQEVGHFQCSIDGDHLMCPFQCDMYHSHNIHRRDPIRGNTKDEVV